MDHLPPDLPPAPAPVGADEPAAAQESARRVGHALRTPLTAIIGFSHILADAPNLTPRQRQAVDMIQAGGQQLLAAIDDLQRNGRVVWEPPPELVTPAAPRPAPAAPHPLIDLAALSPPPPDLLERFHALAQAGNMRNIAQFADELAARCDSLAPLAAELRRLAARYESRSLLALSQRFREETAA